MQENRGEKIYDERVTQRRARENSVLRRKIAGVSERTNQRKVESVIPPRVRDHRRTARTIRSHHASPINEEKQQIIVESQEWIKQQLEEYDTGNN